MGPLARNSPGPPRLRPSLWREATATYRSLQQNSTSRAERVQQEWLYVPYASSVGCPGRPPATQPLAGFPGRVTHPASGGRSGSGGRRPPSLWSAPTQPLDGTTAAGPHETVRGGLHEIAWTGVHEIALADLHEIAQAWMPMTLCEQTARA